MITLLVLALLMLSVAAMPDKGNGECDQWCTTNFPDPGRLCISPAARGRGPCYTCGPKKTIPTQQLCEGLCFDTASNSNHCGACNHVCPTGTTCQIGVCICDNSGMPQCNDACPDFSSDPNNCGSCGNVCASGSTCTDGTCVFPGCVGLAICVELPRCGSDPSCYCHVGVEGKGFCTPFARYDCNAAPVFCASDSACPTGHACLWQHCCSGEGRCVPSGICGGYTPR